jgi:multiple sugar transport system permease protein
MGRVLSWLALIVALAFFVYPLIFILMTSFKPYADIVAGNVFKPAFTTENYFNALFAPGFRFTDYLFNSVVIALSSTGLTVLITFPAAYAMGRLGTGGRNLTSYVFSLRMLPAIIFALPLYFMYNRLGLIDTHIGLIIIYATFNIPLSVLVLKSFIQEIPADMEEAAMIDGCTRVQALRRVVLPLSVPGLVAVSILNYLAAWNEYLFALIFTAKRAATANVAASLFVTAYAIRYGEIAAVVSMAMLPPLIFIFIIQRQLVKGLTLGAIKA